MNNETKNKTIDRIIEELQQLKQCTIVDFSQAEIIDENGEKRPLQPEDILKGTAASEPAVVLQGKQPIKTIKPQTKSHKSAVIIYHSDIFSNYKKEWVDACIASIRNQTFKEFDVLELNYGDDNRQLYESSIFFNEKKRNFIEAMNTLLDMAFDDDYETVFNVNLDDYYTPDRFELQLQEVQKGADLVSSDFCRIGDIQGDFILHDKDVKAELGKTPPNNILCHPVICYTRGFWKKYGPYNPDSIKYEDMELWQKAVNAGAKVHIVPKILCTQRVHNNNVGKRGEKH